MVLLDWGLSNKNEGAITKKPNKETIATQKKGLAECESLSFVVSVSVLVFGYCSFKLNGL